MRHAFLVIFLTPEFVRFQFCFTSGSRSASGIVRMYSAFIQMSLSSVQRLALPGS
jgi:hypothetical protein